ncbi:hypothetical protein ACJX0J_030649, partial [Zea mays]
KVSETSKKKILSFWGYSIQQQHVAHFLRLTLHAQDAACCLGHNNDDTIKEGMDIKGVYILVWSGDTHS